MFTKEIVTVILDAAMLLEWINSPVLKRFFGWILNFPFSHFPFAVFLMPFVPEIE